MMPSTSLRHGSRTTRLLALAGLLATAPLMLACSGSTGSAPAADDTARLAERGAYLVKIIGCDDCHTPWIEGPEGPEPDMTRRLSGHPEDMALAAPTAVDENWPWQGAGSNTAYAGPWGVSFAANLTPDELTGTGIWTEDIFVQTLRTGRHWGHARPILPPMPWQAYRWMTDEDLRAIYAFLRTVPPIRNQVPEPIPGPVVAEQTP